MAEKSGGLFGNESGVWHAREQALGAAQVRNGLLLSRCVRVVGGPPELGIFELPYRKALAVEAADFRRLNADDARLLGRDEDQPPFSIEDFSRHRSRLESHREIP